MLAHDHAGFLMAASTIVSESSSVAPAKNVHFSVQSVSESHLRLQAQAGSTFLSTDTLSAYHGTSRQLPVLSFKYST